MPAIDELFRQKPRDRLMGVIRCKEKNICVYYLMTSLHLVFKISNNYQKLGNYLSEDTLCRMNPTIHLTGYLLYIHTSKLFSFDSRMPKVLAKKSWNPHWFSENDFSFKSLRARSFTEELCIKSVRHGNLFITGCFVSPFTGNNSSDRVCRLKR